LYLSNKIIPCSLYSVSLFQILNINKNSRCSHRIIRLKWLILFLCLHYHFAIKLFIEFRSRQSLEVGNTNCDRWIWFKAGMDLVHVWSHEHTVVFCWEEKFCSYFKCSSYSCGGFLLRCLLMNTRSIGSIILLVLIFLVVKQFSSCLRNCYVQ
jgi:hypothetical protein